MALGTTVAPTLAPAEAQLIASGGTIDFTPTLTAGANVTYSATGLPAWASINSSTGQITGTENTTDTKTVAEITATNGAGSYTIPLSINVYGSTANISQSSGFPFYCNTANRKYTLTENITANGTAIAIIAANVSLDLAGYTITYDNATPITVSNGSFETGSGGAATGWDFTNATNAARYDGDFLDNEIYDGSYSLRFAIVNDDEFVESTGTVTLEANTTYSLSAMFFYGAVNDYVWKDPAGATAYVELDNGVDDPTRASRNTSSGRGIQLKEATLTTGSANLNYTVRVGASHNAAVANRYWFVDDIKIQRTHTYGVATQSYDWNQANYPGLTQYGSGTNATIVNGTITQGSDGATWGHGIFSQEALQKVTLGSLNITVNGANTSAIYGQSTGTAIYTIYGNTLTSNSLTVTSRDSFDGTVVYGIQGTIYGNTITNGPHAGIFVASGSPGARIASNIFANTIQLKVRYTNSFAILAGYGSQIHNNIINCGTGEYTARGIGAGGELTSATTKVFDNVISVQGLANNQEYGGQPIGGAYGIQLEDASNTEVYGNTVTVNGNADVGYAFRYSADGYAAESVSVHDNTFQAISNGAHVACLKFSAMEADELAFEDNTLITNDGIVGATADALVTLTRCHLKVNTPIADAYIIEGDYGENPGIHTNISFVDTTFEDAGSRTYLETAVARQGERFDNGGPPDPEIAFNQQWTTTLHVLDGATPVSGAAVTVETAGEAEVFSGTADGSGNAVAVVKEYQTEGETVTEYGPFAAYATSGALSGNQAFDADAVQTINVSVE